MNEMDSNSCDRNRAIVERLSADAVYLFHLYIDSYD